MHDLFPASQIMTPPQSVRPTPATIPEPLISSPYRVLQTGMISSEPVVSPGSPLNPFRPQHRVTREPDTGVIPPTPAHLRHPPQPYPPRPGSPRSGSDEGPIVVPAAPPVVVQPLVERTRAVPVIIPPPRVTSPVPSGRESPSSSSSGSPTSAE